MCCTKAVCKTKMIKKPRWRRNCLDSASCGLKLKGCIKRSECLNLFFVTANLNVPNGSLLLCFVSIPQTLLLCSHHA
ncbi:unnamed protein product [Brassica rapa subsp. trilocularis]